MCKMYACIGTRVRMQFNSFNVHIKTYWYIYKLHYSAVYVYNIIHVEELLLSVKSVLQISTRTFVVLAMANEYIIYITYIYKYF